MGIMLRIWKKFCCLTKTVTLIMLSLSTFILSAENIKSSTDGSGTGKVDGMFELMSEAWRLDEVDTNQRNYGAAVADVDGDGSLEVIIAGFTGPNLVLKYHKMLGTIENLAVKDSPYEALRDEKGQAICVCACDIDGDGREEIYVLNTNNAYAGVSGYSDKLFKWREGKYVDLFSDSVNSRMAAPIYAGRSVACVDRYGSGKYGFAIATYSQGAVGSLALIEMNEYHPQNDIELGKIVLHDVSRQAGIEKSTGGRGIVVAPLLNGEGRSDIFFVNEGNKWLGNSGANFLFKNMQNGSFLEVAQLHGLADAAEAGRGVSVGDFNHDGLLDIVFGNYEGPNRFLLQTQKDNVVFFNNIATPEFEEPTTVRTVLVGDFDNNGAPEVLFNNINDYPHASPNRMFTVKSYGPDQQPGITKADMGDALEEYGYGTGGTIVDFDNDGMLELFLIHGEEVAQPVDVYQSRRGKNNNWIRVHVFTKYGAPARGASVKLLTHSQHNLLQVIDSGSGYLCQMEPIAHFGLGQETVKEITVTWPDTKSFIVEPHGINRAIFIYHPDFQTYQAALKASNMSTVASFVNVTSQKYDHSEL